ncbi:unnamed protein product [Periconia digitata]|uniref:Uncharacterized protein n=1 Tax=Periconia digitata TaxID=1303443 RepID=A0A9W4UH91_9PLEO|nr:unnamed protein product [Periconia digitata]
MTSPRIANTSAEESAIIGLSNVVDMLWGCGRCCCCCLHVFCCSAGAALETLSSGKMLFSLVAPKIRGYIGFSRAVSSASLTTRAGSAMVSLDPVRLGVWSVLIWHLGCLRWQ